MLFSETMFGEEEIFADYYEGRTYFRLKRAYLAYVSREYVVNGRQVKGCIFVIIANEYRKEEDLPDICKIALGPAGSVFIERCQKTQHRFREASEYV